MGTGLHRGCARGARGHHGLRSGAVRGHPLPAHLRGPLPDVRLSNRVAIHRLQGYQEEEEEGYNSKARDLSNNISWLDVLEGVNSVVSAIRNKRSAVEESFSAEDVSF